MGILERKTMSEQKLNGGALMIAQGIQQLMEESRRECKKDLEEMKDEIHKEMDARDKRLIDEIDSKTTERIGELKDQIYNEKEGSWLMKH